MKLAFSIVNYGQTEATLRCVKSILASRQACSLPCEVTVYLVDNFSLQANFVELQSELGALKHVEILAQEVNLGFAAGHNRAIARILRKNSYDFVWLLNNDCILEREAIDAHLKSAMSDENIQLWGSTLLEQDGNTIQCAGGCRYWKYLSIFKSFGQGLDRSDIEHLKVPLFDYVAGASMFFRIATLKKLMTDVAETHKIAVEGQWLNETFFLYFEELDLAQRLDHKQFGWCKHAFVVHTSGLSTGVYKSGRNAISEYHSTLSALKFTKLYHPHALASVGIFRFFAKSLQHIVSGDFHLIRQIFRAYRDFCRWLLESSPKRRGITDQ
ncbi:MAG: glycosyltransferase family 2 protein [Cyanobacteria bacterium P01_F01_bin.86]